ncbi:MAG: hypothetical protein ACR2HR_07960 [Euzebya sp.]
MSTTTAPTTIIDTVVSVQEQALRLARSTSESAAKTMESWTKQVHGMIPEQFSDLSFEPGTLVPAPTQTVDTFFTFVEGLLGQQREVLTKVVESGEALLAGQTSNKQTSKKTTSTKATTK